MTRPSVAFAFESGRSTWPGVSLHPESFACKAEQLRVREEDLEARGADLYLAWACAQHDASALGHFERVFLSKVDAYVRRLGLEKDAVDEVQQGLRIRLLVGVEPRVGQYTGRGPLGAWVRIIAVRVAMSATRAKPRERSEDVDALGALVVERAGAEVALMRNRYADLFQAALERSLDVLEPRDKTILRMHFVDQLNIDAIGRIYRVHRATIARWLVGIRQKVLANLRQELSLELHTTSSEFRSILDVLRDDLTVSLRNLIVSGDCS
jgi:RNA polymerase sigma-70 factor (ECF subfamily)